MDKLPLPKHYPPTAREQGAVIFNPVVQITQLKRLMKRERIQAGKADNALLQVCHRKVMATFHPKSRKETQTLLVGFISQTEQGKVGLIEKVMYGYLQVVKQIMVENTGMCKHHVKEDEKQDLVMYTLVESKVVKI